MDSIFNVVFIIELLLRIKAAPKTWYKEFSNWFDFFLVAAGVVDTWILTSVIDPNGDENQDGGSGGLRMLTLMRMFRMIRLLKVLRLLRLFRFLRELVLLTKGILGSLRALTWTGLLLIIVCFLCGTFVTRLIGQDCCEDWNTYQDERIHEYFGTLPRSWFTLFQIMTLENWPEVARTVLAKQPAWVLFFIPFIMFTNMAVLNLVTAIVVENVMDISREVQVVVLDKAEDEKKKHIQKLTDVFHQMDSDGDGMLTLEELQVADLDGMNKELNTKLFPVVDAFELFKILDVDGSGEVGIQEFVHVLGHQVNFPPQSKHLLGMSYDVLKIDRRLERMERTLERQAIVMNGQANGKVFFLIIA